MSIPTWTWTQSRWKRSRDKAGDGFEKFRPRLRPLFYGRGRKALKNFWQKIGFVTLLALSMAGVAKAQESPVNASGKAEDAASLMATKPRELGVFASGGFGTNQNSSDKFFNLGGHASWVLTPAAGPGFLRGQFEFGGEVIPFWQAYIPTVYTQTSGGSVVRQGGTFTGFSVVPVIFRWDFAGGKRWVPWVQGAGGVIYTTHKFPSPPGDTSVWNFTPQFGIGAHYFLRPHRSLDFAANAIHISSASLGDKNPGVNASVFLTVGYSWWK
jgi:lipid A 3-O-deacylase